MEKDAKKDCVFLPFGIGSNMLKLLFTEVISYILILSSWLIIGIVVSLLNFCDKLRTLNLSER